MKNITKLVLSIVIVFAAAAVGSLFTFNEIPNWYASLNTTPLTPPNWVFGPVWTILYILMAIALYLVWTNKQLSSAALTAFFVQLFLNSLWSIIFFGQHSLFWAFIEIIVLWLAIIYTIVKFYDINKTAAYLMVPYVFWVTFAGALNFATYLANK